MAETTETVIDLRPASDTAEVHIAAHTLRVDEHSSAWAKVVQPFTFFFLAILAVAMFLPFVFVWRIPTPTINLPADATPELVEAAVRAAVDERSKTALDWAKTILPSAVGFGSAIVGYYFGTRSSAAEPKAKPTEKTTTDQKTE